MRKSRGLWRQVVAMARSGRTAGEIACWLDVGEPYVRTTCRRKGVPLKGKRECKTPSATS